MPTPDGREWLTPREIIRMQVETIHDQHPNISRAQMESLRDSLEDGFRRTGYQQEFKTARLVEKVKDAAMSGSFGPLTIPNTVHLGQPILTPVGEIAGALNDIYMEGFLDLFDDEGNILPQDPEGG